MMLNLFRRISSRPYTFATTKDTINYYQILQIESGATNEAISKAYADLTSNLIPELDSKRFKDLNQAFVILTDSKTRDAYDSLLSVKKSFYNSPNSSNPPATRSYLSTRRMSKEESLKKKANIDQFGRYKGGLPRRNTDIRGKSLGQTGTRYRQVEIEDAFDKVPQFNSVSAEKAQSFKDFHQDERKPRTMKWPWFSFEVDYNYFTFSKFRSSYWPKIQAFLLLFYIIPTLYYTFERFQKAEARKQLKKKGEQKAQKQKQVNQAKSD